MYIYQLTLNQLSESHNCVKESVCRALVTEGMLSQEDALTFCESYTIIQQRPSWFGRFWGKLFGKDKNDNSQIFVLKRIPYAALDQSEEVEDGHKLAKELELDEAADPECEACSSYLDTAADLTPDMQDMRGEMERDPARDQ